jgi:hypothetical protein
MLLGGYGSQLTTVSVAHVLNLWLPSAIIGAEMICARWEKPMRGTKPEQYCHVKKKASRNYEIGFGLMQVIPRHGSPLSDSRLYLPRIVSTTSDYD